MLGFTTKLNDEAKARLKDIVKREPHLAGDKSFEAGYYQGIRFCAEFVNRNFEELATQDASAEASSEDDLPF